MNRRTIAVAAMLLSASSARVQAQPGVGTSLISSGNTTISRVGTRGANFLEIGLGARALGMAGAYGALAEGFSGLHYNLAGSAEITGVAGGINYAELYGKDGLQFTWGGALLPVFGGAVGLQIGQFGSGDMVRTTYDYPQGGDPAAGRVFSYSATTATLSYARRITDRLNVGGGLKYASEGLTDVRSTYAGVDLGVKFRTGLFGSTIGASLTNLGSRGQFTGSGLTRNTFDELRNGLVRVNVQTKAADMPATFRFSVLSEVAGRSESILPQAILPQLGGVSLRAVGDFAQSVDTDLQFALGAELGLRNLAFFRFGHRWMNEANDDYQPHYRGTGIGGGLRLPVAGRHVQFDYAWAGAGELPASNHFGFEFGF